MVRVVTTPFDVTVAIVSSSDDQTTGRARLLPSAALGLACSVTSSPTCNVWVAGETTTDVTGTGAGGSTMFSSSEQAATTDSTSIVETALRIIRSIVIVR